jgi:phenylacetate-coenzyme A ligase PaaK-like adenylate-forming protein
MKIHLQDGLYGLCLRKINRDPVFLRSLGIQSVAAVDAAMFRKYRDHRLRQTIYYAYENSAFYKKIFDEKGISPSDIATSDDLWKVPFTCPEDLSSNSYSFLCTSQGALEKQVTFHSSGTTGIKKKVFFSPGDVGAILRFLSVGMRSVASENARVYIMLPNTQGRGIGALLSQSLVAAGMQTEVGDLEWPSEKHLEMIRVLQPDVIFANARSVFRMMQELKDEVDLAALKVSTLFLTMEHVSEAMRRQLEDVWQCQVRLHYGLAEMGWGLAVECAPGRYHYNEFGVIAEVVDPATGKILPSGSEGELVFTSLGREAMPLLRYRSHDFAAMRSGRCTCGHWMDSIGLVKKRKESVILTAGGREIMPSLLDEWMFRFEEVVDYQVQYHRIDEREFLKFHIEMTADSAHGREAVEKEITQRCAVELGMSAPEFRYAKKGELAPTATEKKLIRICE